MTTPAEVAARFPAGTAVKWKDVELAAFEEHPAVVRHLDPQGRRKKKTASEYVRLVLMSLMFLAPVFAFATVSEAGRFISVETDGRVTIPIAAGIMLLGSGAPLWFLRLMFKEHAVTAGQKYNRGFWFAGVVYVAVAAVMAWVFHIAREPGQDIILWLVPLVVMGLLGMALVVLDLVRMMKTRNFPAQGAMKLPRASVRRAVAELSPAAQADVQARLDAIIVHLEQQGTISGAQGNHARQAELGMLSLRMSQPHK